MVFKVVSIISSLLLFINLGKGQNLLDYQLRLEPVWSRVADALGEQGSVESAEFSPNGKFIVSGTKYDNSVIMWRTSDGAELWRQSTAQEVERVGWSSDGKFVAAGSEDYKVTVYYAENGKIKNVFKHSNGIDGLTWSNKGSLLVTGEEVTKSNEGKNTGWIRVFDITTGKEIKMIDFGNTVNRLLFSNDDQFLLAVGHQSVRIYKVEDWSLQQTLSPEATNFISGTFSPDGKYVLATGHSGRSRGNLFLWDWKAGTLLKQFNHTGRKIESVTWHPNGLYIAHAGHDPYIHIYRIEDILRFSDDAIPVAYKAWVGDHSEYLDFNSDGSFLVSAHQNGLIKLWVWMGEDPEVNKKRHNWVKGQQDDFNKK